MSVLDHYTLFSVTINKCFFVYLVGFWVFVFFYYYKFERFNILLCIINILISFIIIFFLSLNIIKVSFNISSL